VSGPLTCHRRRVHDVLLDSPALRDLVALVLGPFPDGPVLIWMSGPGSNSHCYSPMLQVCANWGGGPVW